MLTTQRLEMRQPELTDAAFFASLLNQASYIKYFGGNGNLTTDQTGEFIRQASIRHEQKSQTFMLLIRENGQAAGFVTFKPSDPATAEISYALLDEFEGRGYAFEAVRALIDNLFTDTTVKKIIARTTGDNLRSQNLLARLGMTQQSIIDTHESKEILHYEMLLIADKT